MNDSQSSEFLPETEPGDHAWDAASGGPRVRCFAFARSDMVILGVASESPQIPSWDDLRAWEIAAVRYQYL